MHAYIHLFIIYLYIFHFALVMRVNAYEITLPLGKTPVKTLNICHAFRAKYTSRHDVYQRSIDLYYPCKPQLVLGITTTPLSPTPCWINESL